MESVYSDGSEPQDIVTPVTSRKSLVDREEMEVITVLVLTISHRHTAHQRGSIAWILAE